VAFGGGGRQGEGGIGGGAKRAGHDCAHGHRAQVRLFLGGHVLACAVEGGRVCFHVRLGEGRGGRLHAVWWVCWVQVV
jgi:hypothetical protein